MTVPNDPWPDAESGKSQRGLIRSKLDPKKVRRINPLGMRVLVKIRRENVQTEAGLYLPEGAKEATEESLVGEVLEVASAVDDDTSEEANISGVPLGAIVIIPKKAGVRVPWDEDIRIVDTKEILAIVHEVDLS